MTIKGLDLPVYLELGSDVRMSLSENSWLSKTCEYLSCHQEMMCCVSTIKGLDLGAYLFRWNYNLMRECPISD